MQTVFKARYNSSISAGSESSWCAAEGRRVFSHEVVEVFGHQHFDNSADTHFGVCIQTRNAFDWRIGGDVGVRMWWLTVLVVLGVRGVGGVLSKERGRVTIA